MKALRSMKAFSNLHCNNHTRLFYPQTEHNNTSLNWSYLGKLKCFIVTLRQNKELDCWSKVAKFLKEPKQKIKYQSWFYEVPCNQNVEKIYFNGILFTTTLPISCGGRSGGLAAQSRLYSSVTLFNSLSTSVHPSAYINEYWRRSEENWQNVVDRLILSTEKYWR